MRLLWYFNNCQLYLIASFLTAWLQLWYSTGNAARFSRRQDRQIGTLPVPLILFPLTQSGVVLVCMDGRKCSKTTPGSAPESRPFLYMYMPGLLPPPFPNSRPFRFSRDQAPSECDIIWYICLLAPRPVLARRMATTRATWFVGAGARLRLVLRQRDTTRLSSSPSRSFASQSAATPSSRGW